MYYVMRVSAPSLHRESTDSLICDTANLEFLSKHSELHRTLKLSGPYKYVEESRNPGDTSICAIPT